MKQIPKHNNILASIEPRIAARMTGTLASPLLVLSKTIKSTSSTIEPKVVSTITPSTFGTLRANSDPANPTMLAVGIMAMKLVMKMARCHFGRAKCYAQGQPPCYTMGGGMYTRAIATGTIGHNMLTQELSVLLLLKQIFKNLSGCTPRLPLSPSGSMPLVISWPLWLKRGRW
jgi:hypothetical protein